MVEWRKTGPAVHLVRSLQLPENVYWIESDHKCDLVCMLVDCRSVHLPCYSQERGLQEPTSLVVPRRKISVEPGMVLTSKPRDLVRPGIQLQICVNLGPQDVEGYTLAESKLCSQQRQMMKVVCLC